MNSENIRRLYEFADVWVKKMLAKDGAKPPCCKGCFHCCREPVYGTMSEVKHIVSLLSDGEREALRPKLIEWREKFKAAAGGEFVNNNLPSAFKYRTFNLWCPLLAPDGTCSIYENRPISCRVHVAWKDAAGCIDEALRPNQKFALFPELSQTLTDIQLSDLEPGETLTFDNFLCLLCEELLGSKSITASRVEFHKTSDHELQVTLYGQRTEETTPEPSPVRDLPVS